MKAWTFVLDYRELVIAAALLGSAAVHVWAACRHTAARGAILAYSDSVRAMVPNAKPVRGPDGKILWWQADTVRRPIR